MKNNKGMNALYITIEETAEYLNLPKSYIEELIQAKENSCAIRWRAIFSK